MLRGLRRDSGQDLVEFALVFPLLMLLLLGIIEFGRIIYSYNAISNLAREGTRYAVVPVHQVQIEDLEDQACPGSNEIVQYVCGLALALPGPLSVTVNQLDTSGNTDPDIVHVEVAYTGQFLTNLILEALGQGDLELRAAATMRLE